MAAMIWNSGGHSFKNIISQSILGMDDCITYINT